MLKHIQSIPIGPHPILISLMIDLLNHILKGFLDVVPSRVKIIHVYFEVIIVHLAETDAFRLFCLEIFEVVLPHPLDDFAQGVVEPVEHALLCLILLSDCSGVFLTVLSL
jgi:hypothetical protein